MRLSGDSQGLVGERVELRRHDRKNYPLYAEWYGDPEVWRLTSWAAAPLNPQTAERLFEEREVSATDDSFAVHLKGEQEPIGVISFTNISRANASAELAVILGRPEDRELGYGAEAIWLLLRYGFEELGLHRVGLSVFEFNEAAMAAYEKLGFRAEGRLREALKREEGFHDAILMSILAPEWRRTGAPG